MLNLSEVYIDGRFIGEHSNGRALTEQLIELRRRNSLPAIMNAAYIEDKDEVQINLNRGRIRRPLVVVKNGKSLLTKELIKKLGNKEIKWKDLISKHIVEYIDAEEEENALVAVYEKDLARKHTHLEIDPLLILGIATSTLAFPEKNRGDRLNYGARMAVQAVGIPAQNFLLRDDTTMNVLLYPQIPLIGTQSVEAIGLRDKPCGQNIIIAIAPFYGYNIEDALIINKASLERGLGRSIVYRAFNSECGRYWGGQEDVFGIPDKSIKGHLGEDAYKKLDEDGIIHPETEVLESEVLVGKTSPLRFLGITKEVRLGIQNFRDNSLTTDNKTSGIVEKVVLTATESGNKLVTVVIRDTHKPEIGDKCASRHGQKGIIGLIVPEEDMPFTAEGVTPDVIINPHAIPSRMTIGQLLEILAGKASAATARIIDGTVFKGDEKEIRDILKKAGYRDDGKETLYNGLTGKKFDAQILVGMIYYQFLYHLVSKKIHARSRGPVALMTKQPTEGRSKEGGLRLGEMEKDCFVAHGAPIVLKERFGSDKIVAPVCKNCGLIAMVDHMKNKTMCPVCKSDKIVNTEMSYAFKLMLDELRSMGIHPQIIPSE